jgi:hypothetical protein
LKQATHCIMTWSFMAGSNFKLPLLDLEFHLHACTSMKHAHL